MCKKQCMHALFRSVPAVIHVPSIQAWHSTADGTGAQWSADRSGVYRQTMVDYTGIAWTRMHCMDCPELRLDRTALQGIRRTGRTGIGLADTEAKWTRPGQMDCPDLHGLGPASDWNGAAVVWRRIINWHNLHEHRMDTTENALDTHMHKLNMLKWVVLDATQLCMDSRMDS
jgi:hypothetical protein